MNPLALARKYRPRTFQEMVGQEVTLRALMNALEQKRLHHAYLFKGTRGVGKTTIARILAKCLNCEQGISSKPCETCFACQAIDAGHFVDLIEVDAASRTKVEDTRELLDNVQYLPTEGRFKIYLIDEVHMLSGHSFNALLKTLEEPPLHVKFLLATTDPQKLPVTVLSRCLQFHLWRVPLDQMVQYLAQVLRKEQVAFEAEALTTIGQAADGSLRDALSLLDQALAFSEDTIRASAVRLMLGLTEKERLLLLLQAVIQGDSLSVLKEIQQLEATAPDFAGLLTEFLTLVHQAVIAKMVPEALAEHMPGKEAIAALVNEVSPEELQLYYQIGLQGQRDLPFAPSPKMGFEMVLLKMIAFQPLQVSSFAIIPSEQSLEALSREQTTESGESIKETLKDSVVVEAADPAAWSSVIEKLNLMGLTKVLAEHCIVVHWTANLIHLMLEETQKPLLNKRYEERLQEALCQYLGKNIQLKITVGKITTETPASQQRRLLAVTQQAKTEKITADAKIQDFMQTFNAKIEHIALKED